jgi:hypothetical protein
MAADSVTQRESRTATGLGNVRVSHQAVRCVERLVDTFDTSRLPRHPCGKEVKPTGFASDALVRIPFVAIQPVAAS